MTAAVFEDCGACQGLGCETCCETGRAPTGRRCVCGDAESWHYRGECVAVKGTAWKFCPCEQFCPCERTGEER